MSLTELIAQKSFSNVTTTNEGVEAVAVGSWVVALNFKYFGYVPFSGPASRGVRPLRMSVEKQNQIRASTSPGENVHS